MVSRPVPVCATHQAHFEGLWREPKHTAPPNGFAKLATAVAEILPFSLNHSSLKYAGALSTNGWDIPQSTCPSTTTPNNPPVSPFCPALVPAYRSHAPTTISALATSIAPRGPCLLSVQRLSGVAMTNAKRKPVDSQLTVDIETPKYWEVVAETGANVNHSQETRILSRES